MCACNNKYKLFYLLTLMTVIAILVFTLQINSYCTASEINIDVKIILDKNSIFSSHEDIFIYSSKNSLVLVKDNNLISLDNAFTGNCKKISLTDNKILVLTTEKDTNKLFYFSYGDSIEKISINDLYNDISCTSISTFKNELYFSFSEEATYYIGKFNPAATSFEEIDIKFTSNAVNLDFSEFNLYNKNDVTSLSFIYDGCLYFKTGNTLIQNSFTTNYDKTSDSGYISLTENDNVLYTQKNDGLYIVNEDFTTSKIISYTYVDQYVSVSTSSNSETCAYVLSKSELCIRKYVKTDDQFLYFNTFDNKDYENPTEFGIEKVAKAESVANIYISPKNLQILATLKVNDYFLILEEKDGFKYIATADGTLGYIRNSVTYLEILDSSSELEIGQNVQALHQNVSLYKHPFASSEKICNLSITEQLTVINNVAEENNIQIWDWYKVSYVDENNEIITGYVKKLEVSKYTQLTAPKILKTVRVKTSSIGTTVNLYALPDDSSEILTYYTDGTELNLAEDYNKDSEWTKINYNETVAYIKTADIQKNGLTSLQIAIIVIVCVAVISTAVVLILLSKRKKFN